MMVAIYDQIEDWDFQVWIPGDIKTTQKITLESGWLRCDGSSLLRAGTYANLFAAITRSATVSISIASPCIVTWASHGLLTGECISFETTGTLPPELVAGSNYYVIYRDANSIFVANSYANAYAGTKVNTSGAALTGVQTCRHNPCGIVDGTHFNIPDMVGAVPRGSGNSAGYTANVTVNQGYKDDDASQGHWHKFFGSITAGAGERVTGSALSNDVFTIGGGRAKDIITDGTNGTPRIGIETKMKNVGVQFIIKY